MPDRQRRKTERFTLTPIFAGLSNEEVARVLSIAEDVEVEPGTHIVSPGDPPNGFFIIQQGRVEIRVPHATAAGATTVLATLSDHSVFGEMSFLGDRPRSAYATAVAPTRLDRVDGDAFRELMAQGDLAAFRVIHNLARLMGSRLSKVEKELTELLDTLNPIQKTEKLAELEKFRNQLYQEWSC